MMEYIPEVVVVGNIELLFLGLSLGAGAPKVARRILRHRYGDVEDEGETEE